MASRLQKYKGGMPLWITELAGVILLQSLAWLRETRRALRENTAAAQ